MESKIWEKMIDSIEDHIHIEHVNADKVIIQGQNECAKACEHVTLQAQIDLLKEIQKDTENTNAKFRIKLIVKINELENQLSEK